eukprot:gene12391-12526_t
MASKLNPSAPEFVPGVGSYVSDSYMSSVGTEDVLEDNITPEELEELEAAEDWVVRMALIEELEQEHLIQVALSDLNTVFEDASASALKALAHVEPFKELNNQGLSLEFDVTEVCLISRKGYKDSFTVRFTVPLGSATQQAAYSAPQQVDVPYVATIGEQLQRLMPIKAAQDRARFGLGAASSGIWNFAYGANMSPAKLGGSRGLHPLESQPGQLPRHRLSFNHRGGFGNVVPVDLPPPATAVNGSGQGAEMSAVQQTDVCLTADEVPGPREGGPAAESALHSPVGAVHGVLHKMHPADMAALMNMEHEYWYLGLLCDGARHWQLDSAYTTWLQSCPSISQGARGDEYYQSPAALASAVELALDLANH